MSRIMTHPVLRVIYRNRYLPVGEQWHIERKAETMDVSTSRSAYQYITGMWDTTLEFRSSDPSTINMSVGDDLDFQAGNHSGTAVVSDILWYPGYTEIHSQVTTLHV